MFTADVCGIENFVSCVQKIGYSISKSSTFLFMEANIRSRYRSTSFKLHESQQLPVFCSSRSGFAAC